MSKPQRSDWASLSVCESQSWTNVCWRLHLSVLLINPPPFPLSKSGWISSSQTSSLNCRRSASGAVLFHFLPLIDRRGTKIITVAERFTPTAPGVERQQAHKRFVYVPSADQTADVGQELGWWVWAKGSPSYTDICKAINGRSHCRFTSFPHRVLQRLIFFFVLFSKEVLTVWFQTKKDENSFMLQFLC